MKKIAAFFLILCCCAPLFGAAHGKTTPSGWYDNFEAARAKAEKENKPLLLLFTGSDWCGYCIKLRKGALDKHDFKDYAKKNLVLVFIDSPRKTRLPAKLVVQNRELKSRYGSRGVPHTVLISADGKVLGRITGCPKDPGSYLERVRKIVEKTGSSD